MNVDKRLGLFVVLAAVFVVSLVVGDIIGGKLTETTLFGTVFTVSVGMVPFPVTFLLTDLLNEFYGKKAARFVTWVGFGMALFAFTLLFVALQIPFAGFTRGADWTGMNQASFDNVFNGSQRILAASMVAYLVAQFTDIALFNALKRLSRNRLLWLRATGSTVVSQAIDTVIIQFIAWYGLLPLSKIANVAVSSYAIKLLVAVAVTPLIYAGHVLVERSLKLRPVRLDERGEAIPEPNDGAELLAADRATGGAPKSHPVG